MNAIVRVDPITEEVQRYSLPADRRNTHLNTAAFGGDRVLWFTGQNGVYGVSILMKEASQYSMRGRGPYGITSTPDGEVDYASLADSHIARIGRATGAATPSDPVTAGQGACRA